MNVSHGSRRISILGGVLLALTLFFIAGSVMTPATLEPVESADAACSDLFHDIYRREACIEDRLANPPGFPPRRTWPWLIAASSMMIMCRLVVALQHRLADRTSGP